MAEGRVDESRVPSVQQVRTHALGGSPQQHGDQGPSSDHSGSGALRRADSDYPGMSDDEIDIFVAEFLARIEDGSLAAEAKAATIERYGEEWEERYCEAAWEAALAVFGI